MFSRFLPRTSSPLWRSCSRKGFRLHAPLCLALASSLNQVNDTGSNHPSMVYSKTQRLYASRSAADGYLLELLKSEIEQTKHTLQKETGNIKEEMLGPFVLMDKPGMEEVVLSTTTGNEKIEILCMLEKQYPQDEDEPEEQKLQHGHRHQFNKQKTVMHQEIVEVLHLSVTMGKAGVERLELDCSFVRGATEIMIEEVMFYESDPALDTDDMPEPYGGPFFEDLDERLQQAFHDLLKARGITTKFALYMMDYMTDKEQREYVRWLQRLRDFLTS